MRHLRLFISFFLFLACKSYKEKAGISDVGDKKYSEQEKRDSFIKNIARRNCVDGSCGGDSSANFSFFMRTYYPDIRAINTGDPIIYAVEEPYIDSSNIDPDRQWVRITRDGTWSYIYCIIAERKNSQTYITMKVADGLGGYYTGTLKISQTITFHDTMFNEVDRTLSKFEFWTLTHNKSHYCKTDGEMWTLEAISHGKYNLVNFYSPTSCGDDTTKGFERLATWLAGKAEIGSILDIFNKEKN